jgi:hypothetical protein
MRKIVHPLDNESGVIIFAVLAFIVAITGATVLVINLSTLELDVSGNNKCQAQAFFNAESGISGMMKIIDRSLEEAQLVDENDSKYAAYTFDESGGNSENQQYTEGVFGGGTVDENAAKESQFRNAEVALLDPPQRNGLHNYNQVSADLNADVNWYYTHRGMLRGMSLEFAAGYEGFGSGRGGNVMFFRVISQGNGCGNATYTVNGEYRWVRR